jgi:hypothetical protein
VEAGVARLEEKILRLAEGTGKPVREMSAEVDRLFGDLSKRRAN